MNELSVPLWAYLSQTPLLWLTVTLVAYVAADRISLASRTNPQSNPLLIADEVIAHHQRTTVPTSPD